MPAPNQCAKKTTVLPKRTTRSSVTSRISTNITSTKQKSSSVLLKTGAVSTKNENALDLPNKRKPKTPLADKPFKRHAFGDITNAVEEIVIGDCKKVAKKTAQVPTTARFRSNVVKPALVTKTAPFTTATIAKQTQSSQTTNKLINSKAKENCIAIKKTCVTKTKTLSKIKEENVSVPATRTLKEEAAEPKEPTVATITKRLTRQSVRISDVGATSSSEDSSLYVSALEELNLSDEKQVKTNSQLSPKPPPGVEDFDKENWDDPNQLSHYAYDIFNYLKSREEHFKIPDYMDKQISITKGMRALLVDWMVEVQENFTLTHETLYLAVKIVDKYLSQVCINRDELQLIGATSLLIASKFDERSPPLIEDIVYIGDEAYNEKNVLETEIKILKKLDFSLGFPLSYRFLRRYARCSKAGMPLLTLARFVLEYCLMEYFVVTQSDSKMAAAALHIARVMTKTGRWTPTLEYYSGYKLDDFKGIAFQMNDILHKKPRTALSTVRNKYSHETFFAVAKTPLVENSEL